MRLVMGRVKVGHYHGVQAKQFRPASRGVDTELRCIPAQEYAINILFPELLRKQSVLKRIADSLEDRPVILLANQAGG